MMQGFGEVRANSALVKAKLRCSTYENQRNLTLTATAMHIYFAFVKSDRQSACRVTKKVECCGAKQGKKKQLTASTPDGKLTASKPK